MSTQIVSTKDSQIKKPLNVAYLIRTSLSTHKYTYTHIELLKVIFGKLLLFCSNYPQTDIPKTSEFQTMPSVSFELFLFTTQLERYTHRKNFFSVAATMIVLVVTPVFCDSWFGSGSPSLCQGKKSF